MKGYDFAFMLNTILDEVLPGDRVGTEACYLFQEILIRLMEGLYMSCQ